MKCVNEGCNGIAHFYCLELDQRPQVWTCMDCTATPLSSNLTSVRSPLAAQTASVLRPLRRSGGRRHESPSAIPVRPLSSVWSSSSDMSCDRPEVSESSEPMRGGVRSLGRALTHRLQRAREHRVLQELNETDFDDLQDFPAPVARLLPSEAPGTIQKSEVSDLILGRVPISELGGQLDDGRKNNQRNSDKLSSAPSWTGRELTAPIRPIFTPGQKDSERLGSRRESRGESNRHERGTRKAIGVLNAGDRGSSGSQSNKRHHHGEERSKALSRSQMMEEALAGIAQMSQMGVKSMTLDSVGSTIGLADVFDPHAGGDSTTETSNISPRPSDLARCTAVTSTVPARRSQRSGSQKLPSLTIDRCFICDSSGPATSMYSRHSTSEPPPTGEVVVKDVVASPIGNGSRHHYYGRNNILRKPLLRGGGPVGSNLNVEADSPLVEVVEGLIESDFGFALESLALRCAGDAIKLLRARTAFIITLAKDCVPPILHSRAVRLVGNTHQTNYLLANKKTILENLSNHSLVKNSRSRDDWFSNWERNSSERT